MVLAISEQEGEDSGNTEAYGATPDCYTELGDLEKAELFLSSFAPIFSIRVYKGVIGTATYISCWAAAMFWNPPSYMAWLAPAAPTPIAACLRGCCP
ncbi:hypothetical protein V6N12_034749 [Hibiscus sabdariffa]|uniref:Uncharacterized protein n=1 Tax=Hibiscus sabdariffa TaxID=183260 RepID=A0ABR2BAD9_9ROSI